VTVVRVSAEGVRRAAATAAHQLAPLTVAAERAALAVDQAVAAALSKAWTAAAVAPPDQASAAAPAGAAVLVVAAVPEAAAEAGHAAVVVVEAAGAVGKLAIRFQVSGKRVARVE